jgi:hypothetical protein
MTGTPSPPWTLRCPWCEWKVIVNARGARGRDEGAGVEAAQLGERHALTHGRTWREFLAESDGAAA